MRCLIGLNSAGNDLINIRKIESSSTIVFDKQNALQREHFGMTVSPRCENKYSDKKENKDLSFLIEVLSDCIKHFGFIDLIENVNKLYDMVKKLPSIEAYIHMSLFINQNLPEKTGEIKESFSKMSKELMQVFCDLCIRIEQKGLAISSYHYSNGFKNAYYDDSYEENSFIENSYQNLAEGVLTYGERILGQEVKREILKRNNIPYNFDDNSFKFKQ